jgi:NADH dehydrogenase FAD-containing subunit
MMTQPPTRILVLGAGIAGLLFTLRLSGKIDRSSVQITLVDEADTFIVRPRLHEFATHQRIFSRPFLQILRKTPVQFVQGRVSSLDPKGRRVTVLDQHQREQELEYDYLVYALGSMTDRHNVPGVAEYAYSLQARGPFGASALRARLPEIAARGGQVVVCGAGATGIETAAQVASVYQEIKVSLVTRGALARSWNESVADQIRRRLVSLGVEIIEQSHVRMSAYTASIMGAHGADCVSARLTGSTPKPLSFAYLAQAIALGQRHALFLTLSADDQVRPPSITGRLGAFTREVFIRFVIAATMAQQRFPGLFVWLGKRRYEQA